MARHRVIVVGGDHHNTLGVIRSLGRAGIMCSLIILPDGGFSPYVAKSRYVSDLRIINSAEELPGVLESEFSSDALKPVVICCHDAMASAIDCNSSKLKEAFFIPCGANPGAITELMNKDTMGKLARECGMSTPPSDGFPCVVKPLVSKNGKKEWMQVCGNACELERCIEQYGRSNLQIQRFIEKEAEYQLIGCSLPDGTVFIPGVSSILRPCQGSNTSFLHYSGPDTIVDSSPVIDFVHRTGYVGLFSVEFVRDKGGRDYFLEMNFRNDGNAICVTKAGVNLPLIWYLGVTGQDYSKELNMPLKPIYVVPEFEELSLLTSNVISFRQFLSDISKSRAGMEFSFKDQRPFWCQLSRRIRHKMNGHA
ncbi:MAG: hypothetical protein IKZ51_00840 [Bacteroidales bacterium]|nr:hypothetical protein [Bacteroidales bacterium]